MSANAMALAYDSALDRYLATSLGLQQLLHPTWLDEVHPEYRRDAMKWAYARDHYTGDAVGPEKIRFYLVRKTIGETIENYEERVALADYTPHMGTLVDELSGMLFLSDDDSTRIWGALGDPKNTQSNAATLLMDADDAGNGWDTVWKLCTIELSAIHRVWLFIDGGDLAVGNHPRLCVVEAERIQNWRVESGVLVEALMREAYDSRTSLRKDDGGSDPEHRWIYMTVDGWQRFGKDKDNNVVAYTGTGNQGRWEYYTRSGARTIPLYKAELPLRRHLGYSLARKANTIFNQESARDNLIRFANFPLLNVMGNDKTYDKVTGALAKGARALQNATTDKAGQAHHFIAPATGPADVATKILERKVEEFYRVGFKAFADVGARSERVTATEVRARMAGGIYAYLGMLKAAVEDAENSVFYLVEQTYFPGDRSKWGKAFIKRSNDFTPPDVNEIIERLRKRYFGETSTVPVGRAGRIAAATEIARWDGLEVNDLEIGSDVDLVQLQQALKQVPMFMQDMPIPDEARAEIAVQFLVATGYLAPDSSSQEGGKKTLDIVTMRAKALATAQRMTAQAAAATAPKPPPGSGGPPKGV